MFFMPVSGDTYHSSAHISDRLVCVRISQARVKEGRMLQQPHVSILYFYVGLFASTTQATWDCK
jgi:hypothetical protein